ncbi:ribonuclease P protein subunit p25a [Puntigrus tetrazona]|uniref:ribonuclease P protein subunit p25a n=1 Tax=Puntigrus tetrazona TaxID=1606681 RepID=UPI001C8AF6BE|nr:ribonuclease P protein subunit p25a [Puntigrus tetrazona]XP_043084390.1 ribonuclease P protein subunit p25a [Puntigrus tetrazona]
MFMPGRELHDSAQSKCTTSVQASQFDPTNPPGSSSKPKQGGFRKIRSTGEPVPCPIPGLPSEVLEMRVKEGSKIRNLLGFAMSRIQGDGHAAPASQVVFSGTGRAVTKTITCAEIMKRKVRGLHQLSKLQYRTVTEVWESQESGPLQMTVHRTLPSICILLSKEPLDPQEPGYQPPDEINARSEERRWPEGQKGTGKTEKREASPGSRDLPSLKRAALGQDKSPALEPVEKCYYKREEEVI